VPEFPVFPVLPVFPVSPVFPVFPVSPESLTQTRSIHLRPVLQSEVFVQLSPRPLFSELSSPPHETTIIVEKITTAKIIFFITYSSKKMINLPFIKALEIF
jgi:hypothetical protein